MTRLRWARVVAVVLGALSPSGVVLAAPRAATVEPTAATVAPVAKGTPGVTYKVRLRDLERRVNELKEQIVRSRARMNLLKETVLDGCWECGRLTLTHRDEMDATYQLVKVGYLLDGQEIFLRNDAQGWLAQRRAEEVVDTSIRAGNHVVSAELVYRGNGYGVFSYLNGYRFTVRRSKTFTVRAGAVLRLDVVGVERGNVLTTDVAERPAIDFRVEPNRVGGAASEEPCR